MDWYLRLVQKKPRAAGLLLVGGALAIIEVAMVTLGPRGSLVPELLVLVGGAGLAWHLGLRCVRAAFGWNPWRKGWAVLALGLIFGAFALYMSVHAALVALDLTLPFDEVEADVVSWQYHYLGRGPGILHLVTADGVDRGMPALDPYEGPRSPGRYRLAISRFEGFLVDAHLLR